MQFLPPFLLLIGLSIVLLFSSSCVIQKDRSHSYPAYALFQEEQETPHDQESRSTKNPMFIRAFKSEMVLELWIKNPDSARYDLFKSYNICQKSGMLGPKRAQGDLQTPEGFYDVTQERLNPNSKYFLSFDIGFPNEYDRALGRTGSHLMIHGNCVSAGCLAMTDQNIAEIYAMVEDNFKQGHRAVPVHIYPFRMTDENMMRRNLSRWNPFWENLKEGYDYFEKHNIPAQASVQNNRYVFNQG